MTLTDFLLARLAEDGAAVRANPMLSSGPRSTARVLADVAAKRAILAWDAEQPVDRASSSCSPSPTPTTRTLTPPGP